MEIKNSERYQYVFFACRFLFYDRKERRYCCSSSGKEFDNTQKCLKCKYGMREIKTIKHIIDLNEV